MGVEEFGPVGALFRSENAGALAERAAVFQGVQDGVSDEFGFVGHRVQGFGQCFIGFEGDGFLFFIAHGAPLAAFPFGLIVIQSITCVNGNIGASLHGWVGSPE